MKVLEARMDRVRFAIPLRTWRWVAGMLAGGGFVLAGGGLAAWSELHGIGPVPRHTVEIPPVLQCPSSDPAAQSSCAELSPALCEGPGLFEAYLARRGHHLTRLLPAAFPPSSDPQTDLPMDWAPVAHGADATLVRRILQDATRDAAGWVPRDPIVGAGLRKLIQAVPDDGDVRAAMDAWAPQLVPLPDRSGQTLEALVEAHVVRPEGAGGHALFAAPEADHVVDAAVADVRRYDALRAAAFHVASEGRRTARFVERSRVARERASHARARAAVLARWLALEAFLALVVVVSAGVGLVWLRSRSVVVTFDGHGLTIGRHRLSWDDVVDLTWREDRVGWTTSQGDGGVGGLSLAKGEVASLQRAALSLRTARFTAGDVAGQAALEALVGRSRS